MSNIISLKVSVDQAYEIFAIHFPQAVQIVELYHAQQHVGCSQDRRQHSCQDALDPEDLPIPALVSKLVGSK